jgi:hypothetical protein
MPRVLVEGGPTYTTEERLEFYQVPGLSLAVIEDFSVVWEQCGSSPMALPIWTH